MDNMLKRLLSFAVALFMVIGLMPWNAASVYATEEDVPAETPTVEETVEAAETVAAVTFECKHCDEEVEWLPLNADTVADYYTGATSAQLNANTHNSFENGHYYLTADTAVQGIDLRTGGDVVIELNGFALSNSSGRMFRLAGSSKVTIQGTGKVVPMKNYTMGTVAYVSGSSTFAMYGGTLDGANVYTYSGSTTEKGGAIRMESSGKEVTLNGVTIVNCKTGTSGGNSGTGGVLSMSTGTANIIGCTISNCSSVKQGGAIHANGGTVNLTNSTISGCSAINGGAAYIMGGATFNVTNSKIESCSASTNGGAIYGGGSSAKVVINSGSEITDCSATTAGGGVYLTTNTALTMNGGKITGCTAAQEGAAVRQNSTTTTFTMNGGEISGNESTNSDAGSGGVRVYGTFDMTGGTIKNNPGGTSNDSEIAISGVADGVSVAVCNISGDAVVTSEDTTNAIYAFKGTLNMTGGTVNGNVVVSNPHYDDEGNLTDNGGTATISGGTVNGVVHAFTNDKDESGEITITGGTYSGDVTAFLAEGYVQYPNGKVGLPCTEHTYDEGVETKAPTCGNPGVKTFTCTNCGATTTEEIAPTGEHEYMYACDATCKNCGELTNPDAAHTIVAVDAVAATCTENGNIAYWYCEICGSAWSDAALTQTTNRMSIVVPAGHTYDDNCDFDCNSCGEYRNAPHTLTTYVEAVVPENCQQTGHDAYWVCADCGGFFGNEDGTNQMNPAWMNYTGDHVRPDDAIDCAVVPCELCGEDTYGDGICDRGDAPACQNATCIKCGGVVYGEGHSYGYDEDGNSLIPLCQSGDCIYCGEHFEYLYEHENGSYAPCSVDGECVYGCGLQYPATGEHMVYNEETWESEAMDPCVGGLCSVCWQEIAPAHEYFYPCDAHCMNCGELTNPDAAHSTKHVDAVAATIGATGNVEYWYCEYCGTVWTDAALTQQSNRFNVITPALEAVAQVGETEYATLGEAIAADGEITLLANIETDAAFVIDSVEVLNLNGFSVSTTENDTVGDGVFTVVSGGDLTINGEGTINGVGGNDYNIAIWANGGKVTINGGTYTNVGATDSTGDTHFDLIYVKNGGEVVINGGTFIAESPAWTLNKHDGTRDDCTIAVYGGTFYGFDVDDNAAEGAGTDFCADGYHAYEDGEYYTVHEITRRYACDGNCSTCYENVTPGEHVIGHVEAVEATCQSMGNIEYWYCELCGACWADAALTQTTNRMSIVTFKDHEYFYECDPVCMNCYEITNPDAAHSIQHVDAVAATVGATGNVEYWYCEYCGTVWTDEALTQQSNRFNVIIPALEAVAEVGGVSYASLAEAVEAAEAGQTVTLLGDTTGAGVVIDKSITIDLNGYTYTFNQTVGSTGTTTLGLQILKNNNVIIKNGTLTSTNVVEGKEVKMLIQNYANLTLTDVNLVDNTEHILYALSNNCGNTILEGNTNITTDAVAFDVYDYTAGGYTVPNVIVNTTGTIDGAIEVSETATLTVNSGSYTDETVKEYVAYWKTVTVNGEEYTNIPELPDAEVKNLGAMEVEGEHYIYDLLDVIPNETLTTSTDPFQMQVAMEFIALDTPEEAAANGYADYTTDFFVKIEGIEGGSFVGDGCYLAGYYDSFSDWVVIPLDGFLVQEGVVYPVITSAGFDFSYVDICTSVEDFICGIYFSEEVLEANPNLSVTLSLGLSKTYEDALNAQFELVDDFTYSHTELDVCFHEVITHVAESCYNVEYWYCEDCGYAWLDEAMTLVTNLKSVNKAVATHELEHVEESCYNTEYWYCDICETYWADEDLIIITNSKNVNKAAPSHNLTHVEESCYNTEYWYCDICETYWADEDLIVITNSKNVNKAVATHELVHVEAVEAVDCQTMGNIEYWYCEACEGVWSDEALTQITNHQSVKTGYGDHKYSSDCDVTCNTCDEETREALAEHAYRNPCDGYCMNCYELTNPDAAHSIVHVEAKAGTDCLTWDGNIEYWTCEYCNQCWDNAEGTGFTMNPMMIKVPGDHKYENGVCSVCGEEDPDYVPELFNLSGSNMKLGGTLEINFFINISNLEGTDNYAVITKVYADGRDDVVKTVNQEDWKPYGNNLYYCSFVVSAKEMTDDLTVIVYNAEGQQVSNEYVDSVAAYGVRMLRKTSVAKEQRVYVDMLNYGAAAQTEFEYHLDKMANAELTADELAYGTQSVEMTNILEKGTGYAGTSLSLKENILFNVFYQKSVLDQAANAKVTYTDHYGNAEEYTIQASEFKAYGSSLGYIEFSDMGVADCSQPITITLYNAEGAELSKTIESAESYAARNSTSDDDIYAMVMKFAAGAYNYFHPSN